jgi:hypothetical protein
MSISARPAGITPNVSRRRPCLGGTRSLPVHLSFFARRSSRPHIALDDLVRVRTQCAAYVLFASLAALCGIGVHLIAELAGLGWQGDAALIFSARHIPLGLLALTAAIALGSVIRLAPRSGKDAIAKIVAALPDGGYGPRFVGLAFAAQFLVFGITEGGEGLPVAAGDIGLAIAAALCASAVGALLVARYQRRVIEALAQLFVIFLSLLAPITSTSWQRIDAHVRVWRCRAWIFAASRRPPPVAPLINHFITEIRSQEYYGAQTVLGAFARICCGGSEPCARHRFSLSR